MNIEQLQSLFAALANCERIDESAEPNTLSHTEIQNIGTEGLNLLDETESKAARQNSNP